MDEKFVFFGCRRMLIRQKFIKSKGRAILGEEDIFSQRQRMIIRRDEKNDLFAKRAGPEKISPFPSYAKRSERHRYHRTYQAFLSCC